MVTNSRPKEVENLGKGLCRELVMASGDDDRKADRHRKNITGLDILVMQTNFES